MMVEWDFMETTLWQTATELGKITHFNGKTHYFYGHGQWPCEITRRYSIIDFSHSSLINPRSWNNLTQFSVYELVHHLVVKRVEMCRVSSRFFVHKPRFTHSMKLEKCGNQLISKLVHYPKGEGTSQSKVT